MSKIGLFYGPEGGNVEKVALLIAGKIGADRVDVHKVKDIEPEILNKYSHIIMGLSTLGREVWGADVKPDWDVFIPRMQEMNLAGKKLAIFGLGDHIAYANNFVDSIGDLAEVVLKCGVELVGRCSTQGYQYNESRAEVNGEFLGLPLDEDFESDKTEERVDSWLEELLTEFN